MSIEKIFLMYLKVNQKDDDAKVDQGVWSWDPVGFFVQHEDHRGNHWGFGVD